MRANSKGGPLPILGQASKVALPTVLALESIWDTLKDKPLFAPRTFWKRLKISLKMRTRLISAHEVRVVAPAHKVNECASCLDNCCVGQHSAVLLRLTDIAALIDLNRTELMTHDKPSFRPEILKRRGALQRQLASSDWQRFPVLKQNKFHACEALNTEGKCTLYPHWPAACARFPYALDTENLEIFYSKRCDSFWVRPDAEPAVHAMREAAVAAYNQRIKDQLMLAFAADRLAELGITRFLRSS